MKIRNGKIKKNWIIWVIPLILVMLTVLVYVSGFTDNQTENCRAEEVCVDVIVENCTNIGQEICDKNCSVEIIDICEEEVIECEPG